MQHSTQEDISAPCRPRHAEAYRRAVDVSPRDYRAWYGLGQTYELVNMPYYALYYFRRCVCGGDGGGGAGVGLESGVLQLM
jgi:hypothetical protein